MAYYFLFIGSLQNVSISLRVIVLTILAASGLTDGDVFPFFIDNARQNRLRWLLLLAGIVSS